MSAASSKRIWNRRRINRKRRAGNVRRLQVADKEASLPKSVLQQTYPRLGKKPHDEDLPLSQLILHSLTRLQFEQAQVATETSKETVGATIASTGERIAAVRAQMLWRRAVNRGLIEKRSGSRLARHFHEPFDLSGPDSIPHHASSKVGTSLLESRLRSLRRKLQRLMPASADQQCDFESLLDSLRSGTHDAGGKVIDAILEIQSTAIPDEKLDETIELLIEFIKKHRSTKSQKVLTAVGASIRKVLLNLPSSSIGIASDLLKSEGSLAIPIEVELEVAKMVVQRVAEDPSIDASQFSELADAMFSSARLYSTAKMVNRDFYNATALNSVLASLLLRHPQSHALCTQVLEDSPSWFSKLCFTRLNRIRNELVSRDDAKSRGLAEHLNSLPLVRGNGTKSPGTQGS